MISKRVLELVRRMAVDEFGDISSDEENLAHAIARVVEAAEFCTNNWCIKDNCHCAICAAMKELELALKGCGV